jgi:lysozyme family protein
MPITLRPSVVAQSEDGRPASQRTAEEAILEYFENPTSEEDGMIANVIQNEGGNRYTHILDKDGKELDPPTKFGVTLQSLRDFRKDQSLTDTDVMDMTYKDASDVYKDLIKRQHVMEYPAHIRHQMFDYVVNAGNEGAWTIVSKYLNKNRGTNLKPPFDWGPKTRKALSQIDPTQLSNDIVQARVNHYQQQVQDDPSKGQFLEGWIGRALKFKEDTSGPADPVPPEGAEAEALGPPHNDIQLPDDGTVTTDLEEDIPIEDVLNDAQTTGS